MTEEIKIDSVDREDIWKPKVEEWLDSFKTEETPIEKRITDYQLTSYSTKANNENEIKVDCTAHIIPVDESNTAWEFPQRITIFIEMTNVDGQYQVDYLDELPRNYDKFLEEFQIWKKENETTETITVQGEKEDLNSNSEIEKISNGLVLICASIIAIVVIMIIIKVIKKKKR